MKLDRFRRRRLVLRRRHRCIRCGTAAPEPGRKCCAACVEVEAEKNRQRRAETARAAKLEAARLDRLRRRRAALERVLGEIDARLSSSAAA